MHCITLPSRCDRGAAADLHAELNERLGEGPLSIDGGGVAQLGLPVLQLLLSARQTADRKGHALSITMSEKMLSMLRTAGVDADALAGSETRS